MQLEAFERTVSAGSLTPDDGHAAIAEFARTLSDQCDDAGPDGPSTRLSAAYPSALKDVSRVLGSAPNPPSSRSRLSRLREAYSVPDTT